MTPRTRRCAVSRIGPAIGTEPVPQVLPLNFVRPCLLLLLREQAAHGYDLLRRLEPFGFAPSDPGRLYRALRALERDGLVTSAWGPSAMGPDRRVYEITREGMEELHGWAKGAAGSREVLDLFLARYREFVALPPASGPVRSTP